MNDSDLIVLQNKLQNAHLSEKMIDELAKQNSMKILEKIYNCTEKIEEAKVVADEANNMKIGWFGYGTKKKINATSNALVQQSRAIEEMNNLMQESIKFTCLSHAYSIAMRDVMLEMINNGFKNSNDQLVRLNKNGKTHASLLIQHIENHIKFANEKKGYIKNNKNTKEKKGVGIVIFFIILGTSLGAIFFGVGGSESFIKTAIVGSICGFIIGAIFGILAGKFRGFLLGGIIGAIFVTLIGSLISFLINRISFLPIPPMVISIVVCGLIFSLLGFLFRKLLY